MYKRRMCFAAALLTVAMGVSTVLAQDANNGPGGANAVTTTTVTGATGTIAQLNYGTNGAVEEFLLGTNILLSFPTNVSGGIGTLGAVGNSVTYSGTAETNSAGFETVRVSTFTNNTTKATYTSGTPTSTTTTYGPTSGTVKQLNYDSDGTIDGFLFTPSGSTTTVFVTTGNGASATLKPLLTVGATVSVTGTTTTTSVAPSTCVTTPTLTTVHASSLIISGQTIVLAGGGGNGGNRGGHR